MLTLLTAAPWKRILSGTATALMTVVMLGAILLAYGTISNRFYRVITIDGNSMAPTLLYGDQIVVTPPRDNLPPGTIVLLSVDGRLVTHRLLGYENGRPVTQGDANDIPDNFAGNRTRVVGVYWLRIPKVGYLSLLIKQAAAGLRR